MSNAMLAVTPREDGTVRVQIAVDGYLPADTEPTSRSGLFDEVMTSEQAGGWAGASDDAAFAEILRYAAAYAEGLAEIAILPQDGQA